MNARRTFLSLALASIGLLAVFGTHAAAGDPPESHPPHGGHVLGIWGFPDGTVPGKAEGVLFEQGKARFVLKADLFPGSADGDVSPDGVIKGRLFRITHDGKLVPFALVRGHWADGPKDGGVFRMKILRIDGGGDLKVIGAMKGTYDRPEPDKPGRFRGHWGIHP